MNTPNDNSVQQPGANPEIRGVVPVSDHTSNAYAGGKEKRKVRRKKKAKRRSAPETLPADPDREDESEDAQKDAGDGHKVDHLA